MNKNTIEEIKRIWKWERGVNPEYQIRVLLNEYTRPDIHYDDRTTVIYKGKNNEIRFDSIGFRIITLEMIVTLTKITYKDESIYVTKMISDDIDRYQIFQRVYESILDKELFGDTTMLEKTKEWIEQDNEIDEEERETRMELLDDMINNKGIYNGTIKLYKKLNNFKKELKEKIDYRKHFTDEITEELRNKLNELIKW